MDFLDGSFAAAALIGALTTVVVGFVKRRSGYRIEAEDAVMLTLAVGVVLTVGAYYLDLIPEARGRVGYAVGLGAAAALTGMGLYGASRSLHGDGSRRPRAAERHAPPDPRPPAAIPEPPPVPPVPPRG